MPSLPSFRNPSPTAYTVLPNSSLPATFPTKIFADFKNTYGIDENTVVKICGKNTDQQIGADEIALLVGLLQSLKDGDTTVDEVLDYVKSPKEKVDDKKAELKNKPGKAPTLL